MGRGSDQKGGKQLPPAGLGASKKGGNNYRGASSVLAMPQDLTSMLAPFSPGEKNSAPSPKRAQLGRSKTMQGIRGEEETMSTVMAKRNTNSNVMMRKQQSSSVLTIPQDVASMFAPPSPAQSRKSAPHAQSPKRQQAIGEEGLGEEIPKKESDMSEDAIRKQRSAKSAGGFIL